jgi:hypothetical protein
MSTSEFSEKNKDSNCDRKRYYGIRVGDIVSPKEINGKEWCKGKSEVIGYGILDNNKVYIRSSDGTKAEWAAAWCDIVTKVEDKLKHMNGFTEQEQEIMSRIVEVHSMYIELEKTHPSDLPEWVNSIHNLQKIIGMRILRRELPDTFPTISNETSY